ITNLILCAQQWGMNGRNKNLSMIEKWGIPTQENKESLFKYYESVGIAIGSNNPTKAIDYLTKAIELAETNDFSHHLFIGTFGERLHLWSNVGVDYQRLEDKKNAAHAFLKASICLQKNYPSDEVSFKTNIALAVHNMMQHYEAYKDKNNKLDEYIPFLSEYSMIGDLDGLSNLCHAFIVAHDFEAIQQVELLFKTKESDPKQIINLYIAFAEQLQYDGAYHAAADYHFKAIFHSEMNNQPLLSYWEYEGLLYSRWSSIAYCLLQAKDYEGHVHASLMNVQAVLQDLGKDTKEYEICIDNLYTISADERLAPILERIIKDN
ncbi:hypothetical protein LJC54_01995, partial [Parabacteroides sp. OttesenSCG-928-J18]|nr:hypothetical protein [Parabacteroides sp. OttesenSCG-928-J18]